jgi:hypothetical protein
MGTRWGQYILTALETAMVLIVGVILLWAVRVIVSVPVIGR